MKPLRIPQTIHGHINLLNPQLRLNSLQRSLQTQTKVNLLRRCPTRYVPIELRHGLYGFDPRVRRGLGMCYRLGVFFRGMWEKEGRTERTWAYSIARDCGVGFGDFDVLLEVELEFGKFLFGHSDAWGVGIVSTYDSGAIEAKYSPILLSPSFPPPHVSTKASNQGLIPLLTTGCKLS